MQSKLKRAGVWLNLLGRFFFTAYIGVLMLIFVLPILLSILLTPRSLAQKLVRWLLRLFFRLAGWWVHIEGQENLTYSQPMIYVSNHASYLDSLLVMAVLPPGVALVGKKELIRSRFVRWLIDKLDHLTVERRDVSQSLLDLSAMEGRLQKGQSLMIFPEGTFTVIAGLRPFKLGAFKLAVESGTMICPIAINGTRQILPDESHLVRPSRIRVTISTPIVPRNKDWQEVLSLRTQARAEIAKSCGEPVFNIE